MPGIPKIISDNENTARIIFSPFHIDKKNNRLKFGAYTPTFNSNKVSMLRFEYTCEEYLIKKGKKMEAKNKKMQGYALILAKDIRNANIIYNENQKNQNKLKYKADIKYSRSKKDIYHSHIEYNYIFEKDIEPPPEIILIIQKLIEKSKYFQLSKEND